MVDGARVYRCMGGTVRIRVRVRVRCMVYGCIGVWVVYGCMSV